MEDNKTKQERTVIHLYFKEKDEHFYFGSMANIFEHFSKEDIGIIFGSLRNYGLSTGKPYENKKVIIRKGILKAKPKKPQKYIKPLEDDKPITEVKQKKKFDKMKMEQYLSTSMIRHFNYYKKRGYIAENPEYKDLINSISKIHNLNKEDSIHINSTKYLLLHNHITDLLSKICNDKNEINSYKEKIDAKFSWHMRMSSNYTHIPFQTKE